MTKSIRSTKIVQNIVGKLITYAYYLPSILLLILAKLILPVNSRLKYDFEKIKDSVIHYSDNIIDKSYFITLIAAEDHRFDLHFGVDFIAIVRAIYFTNIKNRFQGASTIEQQLVRVVTFRYERSFRRKFREQLLAILIAHYFDKSKLALSYLSIAYFGYNIKGVHAAKERFIELEKSNCPNFVAALLKYPNPKNECANWRKKIEKRVNYINIRKIKYSEWIYKYNEK